MPEGMMEWATLAGIVITSISIYRIAGYYVYVLMDRTPLGAGVNLYMEGRQ